MPGCAFFATKAVLESYTNICIEPNLTSRSLDGPNAIINCTSVISMAVLGGTVTQ
jgi:hypothetical protein